MIAICSQRFPDAGSVGRKGEGTNCAPSEACPLVMPPPPRFTGRQFDNSHGPASKISFRKGFLAFDGLLDLGSVFTISCVYLN